MKTIAKIIRLLEQIETIEEWEDVFFSARLAHDNFNKQQRILRNNKIKMEERQKNKALKAQWKEGDRVYFFHNYTRCLGVITKRNPKRAKIQIYVGIKGNWAIAYGQLIKITEPKDIIELTIGKMEG